MNAKPGVVLAKAVLHGHMRRPLETDSVSFVMMDDTMANGHIFAFKKINAASPATVDILGPGAIALYR